MAKVTVVIATRNAAVWITETLESVRAQTYPSDKIETIVVDYGSTDASVPLARWFLERHRMKGAVIATDQTTGIGAALNTGWRAATGDWVQLIKGQSRLAPNKIEVQASLIPQLPVDVRVVSSSWQCMGSDGSQRRVPGPIFCPNLQTAPPVVLPSHEACPVVLKVVSNRCMPLGASLFRRGAIQDVGGFSEEVNFAVDEHFMLKMLGVERGNPSDLSSGPVRRGTIVVATVYRMRDPWRAFTAVESWLRTRAPRKRVACACDFAREPARQAHPGEHPRDFSFGLCEFKRPPRTCAERIQAVLASAG